LAENTPTGRKYNTQGGGPYLVLLGKKVGRRDAKKKKKKCHKKGEGSEMS